MKSKQYQYLIKTQAKKYGDKVALYDRLSTSEPWKEITWNQFDYKVDTLSKSLIEIGVNEFDRIAQFSQNKSENLLVDFASYSVRGIIVPIYPTSTVEQVEFITNDAGTAIIFVGSQKQYDVAVEVAKKSSTIKKIIVFEDNVKISFPEKTMTFNDFLKIGEQSNREDEVEARRARVEPKDILRILYTSGTTGNPKGVILTHEMYIEAMRIHEIRLSAIDNTDVSISFLPLTHVFEGSFSYLVLHFGGTIYLNQNPNNILHNLEEVRPTLMSAVPRFWEKVYIGVKEVLSNYPPIRLALVTWAIAVGKKHNIDYLSKGKRPNLFLRKEYKIADKIVLSKVKKTLGLENAKLLPTAGAKMSKKLLLFFRSIGIPINYGYGLTESTATVSCMKEEYRIDTVGAIMPDLQVKIGNEDEILLKGKTITPGYYNNEEANKEAFTEDGWFKTGDAGRIEGEDLILTDRIKDLFKTSNGKYIAPQEIETRLGADKYINQAIVVGDGRNFVTAIITPAIEQIENYAKKNNIKYKNIENLLEKPEIYKLIEKHIAEQQKGMANYELIKKFILIDKEFTIDAGELTNTLKIRRTVVTEKYKNEIDALYEN